MSEEVWRVVSPYLMEGASDLNKFLGAFMNEIDVINSILEKGKRPVDKKDIDYLVTLVKGNIRNMEKYFYEPDPYDQLVKSYQMRDLMGFSAGALKDMVKRGESDEDRRNSDTSGSVLMEALRTENEYLSEKIHNLMLKEKLKRMNKEMELK